MISIIVPVLNEVGIIGPALEALVQQRGDFEVIVVDGGSLDGTCDIVQLYPLQLVRQPPGVPAGLGNQINRGAARARGDILVFLHIDVELPPLGTALIEAALADPRFIGGGFVPAYRGAVPASERLPLAVVERAWQAGPRLWHIFAGDTAPFIRSAVFQRGGGYPPAGFASDWDFAAKLIRLGRLAVIREPALVQSRRLVQNGVMKTMLVTWSIGLMYGLGVDRGFLRNWYQRWLPRER